MRTCLSHKGFWTVSILGTSIVLCWLESAQAAPVRLSGPGDMRLAYLDPGAGSILVQALVATLAGILVATRTYWSKIKGFFGASPDALEGESAGNEAEKRSADDE